MEEVTLPGAWPPWAQAPSTSTTMPPPPLNRADDLAVLTATAGPVEALSHGTLCETLASLALKFPLTAQDRMLSLLPLHEPLELACGLLLPLSRGARVAYWEGASLDWALQHARPTVLVGNPAVWQDLERQLRAAARSKGPIVAGTFEALLEVGRRLNRSGVQLGRLLFEPMHRRLGGELEYLINGDGVVAESTYRALTALGLRMSNAPSPQPDPPRADDFPPADRAVGLPTRPKTSNLN
jgi:long-chain acyl-CoA synthetase